MSKESKKLLISIVIMILWVGLFNGIMSYKFEGNKPVMYVCIIVNLISIYFFLFINRTKESVDVSEVNIDGQ